MDYRSIAAISLNNDKISSLFYYPEEIPPLFLYNYSNQKYIKNKEKEKEI